MPANDCFEQLRSAKYFSPECLIFWQRKSPLCLPLLFPNFVTCSIRYMGITMPLTGFWNSPLVRFDDFLKERLKSSIFSLSFFLSGHFFRPIIWSALHLFLSKWNLLYSFITSMPYAVFWGIIQNIRKTLILWSFWFIKITFSIFITF